MKKWEYEWTTNFYNLEVLGKDGWELISVLRYETETIFYLKREYKEREIDKEMD